MNQNLTVALLCVLLLTNCKEQEEKDTPATTPEQTSRLPLPNVDVPFDEYTVDAAKGDTLVYKSGSVILFPPNAFADKDGKLITGKVQVKYREFADPLDIYLAGVSMNYDSAGKNYTFESMAMCEVLAFQNGSPVYVNQKSKPEINLVARNSITSNLYYYDSVKQNWIYKGNAFTATMAELSKPEKKSTRIVKIEKAIPTELIMPRKADGSGPLIRVFIEAGGFPELMAYDNIKFQLDTAVQKFSPADSEEEWNDIKLERGNEKEIYVVHLSNSRRSVKFIARPVFEEGDYEAAMRVFNEKVEVGNRARAEKMLVEKKQSNEKRRQYEADSVEYARIIKENERILEKNRQTLIQNEKTARENEKIIVENARKLVIRDSMQQEMILRMRATIEFRQKRLEEMKLARKDTERILKEVDLAETAIMAFPIDNFGRWNIDKININNSLPIYATFLDKKGNQLALKRIAVCTRTFNLVIRYADNNITLVENTDNIIIGVVNNQLAYFVFKDVNRYKIGRDLRKQEFTMNLVDEDKNNYADLRAIFKR
jgi:hypothetical protein